MAFKISIVPFHLWAADVYEGAPVSITSYLSVISKGAAVFILMMILIQGISGCYRHVAGCALDNFGYDDDYR